MQVAQTSALTDRQEEERRILDLEDAIKSVSLMILKINPMSHPVHHYYVIFTTVTLLLNNLAVAASFNFKILCDFVGAVGTGETGPAVTGVSAEGGQGRCGARAEGPVCCVGSERRGYGPAEGRV